MAIVIQTMATAKGIVYISVWMKAADDMKFYQMALILNIYGNI